MEAREGKLAVEAAAHLKDLADQGSASIVAQALAGTRAAQASLGQADGLVGEVQDSLTGQVGKDLEYVAKVGDDYGKVPTDERKARAEHWSSVALDLSGTLDQALGQGHALELLAKQAMSAAQQAEGQVSTMA
jgi:hypothetical protein